MARHTYTHPLFPFSFSLPCSPQQVLSQTVLEQSFCLSLLGAPQCELLCLAEGSSLVVRGREGEDQCLLPHLWIYYELLGLSVPKVGRGTRILLPAPVG